MFKLVLQADLFEVVMAVEEDEAAEVEVEVEVIAHRTTRMLHAIAAKRKDISLITAWSQPQYRKMTVIAAEP